MRKFCTHQVYVLCGSLFSFYPQRAGTVLDCVLTQGGKVSSGLRYGRRYRFHILHLLVEKSRIFVVLECDHRCNVVASGFCPTLSTGRQGGLV